MAENGWQMRKGEQGDDGLKKKFQLSVAIADGSCSVMTLQGAVISWQDESCQSTSLMKTDSLLKQNVRYVWPGPSSFFTKYVLIIWIHQLNSIQFSFLFSYVSAQQPEGQLQGICKLKKSKQANKMHTNKTPNQGIIMKIITKETFDGVSTKDSCTKNIERHKVLESGNRSLTCGVHYWFKRRITRKRKKDHDKKRINNNKNNLCVHRHLTFTQSTINHDLRKHCHTAGTENIFASSVRI